MPVASTRVAEATKILENIYRAVNIALVNELKIAFERMGIDVWDVIEAAKTKPFGFQPFYPGPGLGGHCIPIDPFYLTWKAREYGVATRFIELAGEINAAMPAYVVQRLMDALNERGKALKGARVLVLGAAYKKDTDDSARVAGARDHGGAVPQGRPGRLQRPAPGPAAGGAAPQHRSRLGRALGERRYGSTTRRCWSPITRAFPTS